MENNSSSFIDQLEPDYEESLEMDSTVMDLEVDDFTEKSIKVEIQEEPQIKSDELDSSDLKAVDDMLKKEKGFWNRLKSIFRK